MITSFTATCRCAKSDFTELRLIPPILESKKVINSTGSATLKWVGFGAGINFVLRLFIYFCHQSTDFSQQTYYYFSYLLLAAYC